MANLTDYSPPAWWIELSRFRESDLWEVAKAVCAQSNIPLVRNWRGVIAIEWCGRTPTDSQLAALAAIPQFLTQVRVIETSPAAILLDIGSLPMPVALAAVEAILTPLNPSQQN